MKRAVNRIVKSKSTIEGAGVILKRVFGSSEVPLFDPFLLLDHFGSGNPEDYIKGFPWHPHRGIETVTYMLTGEVEHGDSLGNSGTIRSGDIQWMTAGSGIIHQEMPRKYDGTMQGFQLWVNLPAETKMTAPRYRGITADQIPTLKKNGAQIKVIAGTVNGTNGPVRDLMIDIEYFDVKLAPHNKFEHTTKRNTNAFIYIIEGSGHIEKQLIGPQQCVLLAEGSSIELKTEYGVRFLFVSGKPLNEPIAWGGPIVMSTQEDLETAFQELKQGTFVKDGRTVKSSSGFYLT